MLAVALGRGYVGRHRLAEAALGRAPGSLTSETLTNDETLTSGTVLVPAAPASPSALSVATLSVTAPNVTMSDATPPGVTMSDAGQSAAPEPDPVALEADPVTLEADVVTLPDAGRPATPESDQALPAGRSSVAPWLRVVPTPAQPDQLADTLPHPVVTLFPLARTVPPQVADSPEASSPESADAVEQQVFAALDAERERSVTADLAVGAGVRPYRPRHTA